jgi:AcrR family transcriptional regulator
MEEHRGRRKKTKPPLQRKEEILRKTLRLFLSKGYEATTTNDICRAANMTKPTLYYYFPSKRDVLHAAHQQAIENIVHPYLDKSNAIKDPLGRLYNMLTDYTMIVCAHPELRFLLHETLNIRDGQSKKIRKEWKRHYLLFRDTIVELQAGGSIRPELKPSGAALMLLGMVTWITYWFDYSKKGTIDETVSLVIDMACHSLGLQEYIAELSSGKIRDQAEKRSS